jgi:hypothetical protein
MISLILIVICKYLVTVIIANSLEYISKTKYLNFLDRIYIDDSVKANAKTHHLEVREKGGNVTTAFITLLFQNKLRNKITYLVKLLNN